MEEGQETFLSHLIELRERLVKCLVVFFVACAPTLYFSAELYDVLAAPLMANLPEGSRMIATGVITPFLIPVKIAFMAAFVVVLPFILYQVWAFVAPGLYLHEKRLALPLVVSSTLLFLAGMVFCYFVVFGGVFRFIATFAPKSISVAPDIEAYFNFVLGCSSPSASRSRCRWWSWCWC
jgi:sec-independent protein translocase protein TatC